jgi:hypothetical protein
VSFASWSLAMLHELAVQDWDAYLRAIAGLARSPDLSAALQRLKQTVSQEDWLRLMGAALESNIEPLLPQVHEPTLVLRAIH